MLADAEKRAAYDRYGHQGVGGAAGGFDPTVFAGFEDILGGLGDMFGFGDIFGGGRRRGGPQRGADLRYDLEIGFVESARGVDTTIQIPRLEPCEHLQRQRRRSGHEADPLPAVPGTRPAALPAGVLRGVAHVRAVRRLRERHPESLHRPAAARAT